MGKKAKDRDEQRDDAGFKKGGLWQPANRYRHDPDDDHRDAGGPADDDDRDSD